MKLVRWGRTGAEKPGLVDGQGKLRDLSGLVDDIRAGIDLSQVDEAALPLVDGTPRLGVPLTGIGNLICVGLNYRDHAAETGLALPPEPVVFSKHTGALAGPFDPLPIPDGTRKLDWECELAVVVGKRCAQVAEDHALDHVFGYMAANDVSARDWQMDRGGQWIKGKSGPGFCPLGPFLVTADQVADPQDLALWTSVNGVRKQDGNTRDMVFGVAFLLSYLSRFMPLLPGDVVLTGTPAGVGLATGQFLAPGDVMEVGVQGLGSQRIVLN